MRISLFALFSLIAVSCPAAPNDWAEGTKAIQERGDSACWSKAVPSRPPECNCWPFDGFKVLPGLIVTTYHDFVTDSWVDNSSATDFTVAVLWPFDNCDAVIAGGRSLMLDGWQRIQNLSATETRFEADFAHIEVSGSDVTIVSDGTHSRFNQTSGIGSICCAENPVDGGTNTINTTETETAGILTVLVAGTGGVETAYASSGGTSSSSDPPPLWPGGGADEGQFVQSDWDRYFDPFFVFAGDKSVSERFENKQGAGTHTFYGQATPAPSKVLLDPDGFGPVTNNSLVGWM